MEQKKDKYNEYVTKIAKAYESEFPGATLDGEWLGTAYSDLPSDLQSAFSYAQFQEDVDSEIGFWRTEYVGFVPVKALTVTAQEENGRKYTFQAFEIESGECCVPYETSPDGWFADRDSIEANGTAQVVNVEQIEGEAKWTKNYLYESVNQSAREYGIEALPESLKYLIEEAHVEN